MKLLAATALCSLVTANLEKLESLYERTLQLMNASNPTYVGRSSRVTVQFAPLQEYGCWCYFDELHGIGHGISQDGYDDACMALHHGISCAMMEIEACDPRSESTDARLYIGRDGNVEYDCTSLNGGNACKEATCYMEAWFTKLIIAESLENLNLPDYEGLKVSNGFDRIQCQPNPGPHVPRKFCCGTHEHNTKKLLHDNPDFPRSCCENPLNGVFKTFDPNVFDCCDDGNPRLSC